MGRPPPSLTATPDRGRRSTRVLAVDTPDSTGSSSVAYPRRFPRLGPAYQHTHDDNGSTLIPQRPSPIPMSLEIPYRTAQEVETDTILHKESVAAAPSPAVTAGSASETSTKKEQQPYPTNPSDPFYLYAQGLMEDTAAANNNNISSDDIVAWTHEVVQWHDLQEQQRQGQGARKSRFKRPASETLPRFTSAVNSNNNSNKKGKYEQQTPPEQVRAFREGQPTAAQASWTTLVQLTRGQAASAQRARLRQQYQDRFKQPVRQSTESWRQEYARAIDIRGDYRTPSDEDSSHGGLPPDSALADVEYAKSVWKAVLACTHTMENVAGNCKDTNASVTLPAVLEFIGQACMLPPPEDLFRGTEASHMVEEISKTMWSLLNLVQSSRNVHAKLVDAWYSRGVDAENLRKLVESSKASSPLQLVEIPELQRQIQVVSKWQGRLDEVLGVEDLKDRADMATLVALGEEAETHGFVSKGKVALDARLEKAYALEERIREWQTLCRKEKQGVKSITALVREIRRTKFMFAAASEILELSSQVDAWVERANIAIRSKISLSEIEELIAKGENMTLDVSDYLEKLKSRASLATEWLSSCENDLPSIFSNNDEENGTFDYLAWMKSVRERLSEDSHEIHVLACEGARVPVDIEKVCLLQIELDARSWTSKARTWLEKNDSSKRGKIEDLQEHMEKAEALRSRLCLSKEDNDAWVLDGEKELGDLVATAEAWYDRYEDYLDGDNRRSASRRRLSLAKLRQIVQEGASIHANLGTVTSKITKILNQAEAWHEKYLPLLERCRMDPENMSPENYLQVYELEGAVEAANSEISLELDEAVELEALLEKIQSWKERASVAISGKRRRIGKKITFTLSSLGKLIEDASGLPIGTDEDVTKLREQLQSVLEWQARSSIELEKVGTGFQHLRESITETYKKPSEYVRGSSSTGKESEDAAQDVDEPSAIIADKENSALSSDLADQETPANGDSNSLEDSTSHSVTSSEPDHSSLAHLGSGDCNVHTMISALAKESSHSCIITPEGEIVSRLQVVWRWCMRSLKYLENHRDVFDERFFGAFDRFLKEGRDLLKAGLSESAQDSPSGKLATRWCEVADDQLKRLGVLLEERNKFVEWSKKAEQVVTSGDKKVPLDKVRDLELESRGFPEEELVLQLKELVKRADSWAERASSALESDEKLSLQSAKALFDEGQKLGINCPELKTLRVGLKEARSWAAKVRKCKCEQGGTDSGTVKDLHDDYESLIISMPEEVSKLRQAMRSYCLCRKPYEGFMVGCDECDEWYHGVCVGVTELKADRVAKYLCLRCCVKKGFRGSATTIANIIRKWTNRRDLLKSRQAAAMKHQRKFRKETKDLEKLELKLSELRSQVEAQTKERSADAGVVTPVDNGMVFEAAPTVAGDAENVSLDPMGQRIEAPVSQKTVPNLVNMQNIPLAQQNPQEKRAPQVGEPAPCKSMEKPQAIESSSSTENMESKADQSKKESLLASASSSDLSMAIDKTMSLMTACKSKMSALTAADMKRKQEQALEDTRAADLAIWCLRVRSHVLIPESSNGAALARPSHDGCISEPMKLMRDEARERGLESFADVQSVQNHFECMAWYLLASSRLVRQPSYSEIKELVQKAVKLNLPEEKSHRMMKSIFNRAKTWQNRVRAAIDPRIGEEKPYNVKNLIDLSNTAEDIPLSMPMEPRLLTVIEDKGGRHCLCCGPSDGRFMLSCDKCKRWFHGTCVNITKDVGEDLDTWVCPGCSNQPVNVSPMLPRFHDVFDIPEDVSVADDRYDSGEADALWPPFGLKGSEKAVGVLGEVVSRIPDDKAVWRNSAISEQVPRFSDTLPSSSATTRLTPVVEKALVEKKLAPSATDLSSTPLQPPSQPIVKQEATEGASQPSPPASPTVGSQTFMVNPLAIPMIFSAMQGGHLSLGGMMTVNDAARVGGIPDAGVGNPGHEVAHASIECSVGPSLVEKTTQTGLAKPAAHANPEVVDAHRQTSTEPHTIEHPMENDSKKHPTNDVKVNAIKVGEENGATALQKAEQQSASVEKNIGPTIEEKMPEPIILVAGNEGGKI